MSMVGGAFSCEGDDEITLRDNHLAFQRWDGALDDARISSHNGNREQLTLLESLCKPFN